MKIKKNITYLFLALSISLFTSCDEGGEPTKEEIGATTTVMYAGDWFITLRDSDGNPIPGIDDNALHSTYNTAANDNTMWLDDHENGYFVKAKFAIDLNSGVFGATDVTNVNDGGDNTSTVTITEGKITKFGAFSKAGHPVDKIEFRVHYSYDPVGYDILYVGHKRTGFGEDEY